MRIRYDVLGKLLIEWRTENGFGLRRAAKETGISASTLSRIERGIGCQPEQVATLCERLNISSDRVMGNHRENTLQGVKAMLLADPKLIPEQSKALCDVLQSLYRQMTKRKG
jgi:transcriptional regulator with XRE-family HTH domain